MTTWIPTKFDKRCKEIIKKLRQNDNSQTKVPLILSREIDNQKMLQPDWIKDTVGYNQPKVIVSDATFP